MLVAAPERVPGSGTGHGEGDEERAATAGGRARSGAHRTRCPRRPCRSPQGAEPAPRRWAPVEPEEGDESGRSLISISVVQNRGRLGAVEPAWVVGWLEAPSPFPFPAADPRAGGTGPPGDTRLLRAGAQGSGHGVSCAWGLDPRGAVWPPGTARTGEVLGVPRLLHPKALAASLPACCKQVRNRTKHQPFPLNKVCLGKILS